MLCFYRCSLIGCLWWSVLCGFIVDLFSAEARLGTYAINYCLTSFCLFHYKIQLLEDRLNPLPIMVFGFTFLSTLTQIVIFYMIGKPFSLSWQWALQDLLIVPLQGVLYTVLAFIAPSFIIASLKRRYMLFRLHRRYRS
jgi:rod shape-determining protein MreD